MASLNRLLTQLNEGSFLGDCSDKLTELVKAVEETGKAATMTITIGCKPTQGKSSALVFAAKCNTKLPELPPEATLLFTDSEGELHVDDPRQLKLDLKPVGNAKPELRNVS